MKAELAGTVIEIDQSLEYDCEPTLAANSHSHNSTN